MRILLTLAFLLLSIQSQAATITQLRTRVDTWLTARWSIVTDRQANYLANRGTYWQGLITHTVTPTHTTAADSDTLADRLDIKPGDVAQTWLQALPELEGIAFPAALVVDVYNGPLGHGYVATIYVRHNGTLYSRSQNVGPETWRTEAWHVVNETL